MTESAPQVVAGGANGIFNLENILGENHDAIEHPGINGAPVTGWDEEMPEKPVAEGFCVECEGEVIARLWVWGEC